MLINYCNIRKNYSIGRVLLNIPRALRLEFLKGEGKMLNEFEVLEVCLYILNCFALYVFENGTTGRAKMLGLLLFKKDLGIFCVFDKT